MTVIAVILISVGVAFLVTSAIGLIRLPDFYLRAHAVAKAETIGIFFVLAGLVAHERFGTGTAQMLLIMALALVTTPTAVHALADAARRTSLARDGDDIVGDDTEDDLGRPAEEGERR